MSDTIFDSTIDTVKVAAEKHLSGSRGSHDWEHTLRVCKLCHRIGTARGADMTVLMSAAYLHDIGRSHQDRLNGAVCHAQKGAEIATPIVQNLSIPEQKKENILHCVRTHRFRGDHAPETGEARVLFDADKLDAIGAVGVARAFLFAGEVGARLHNPDVDPEQARPYTEDDTGYREYRVKLCRIKDRMLTGEGRKIAQARHAFMERFFNRFIKEYQGED
jgi:uncharacterized protein